MWLVFIRDFGAKEYGDGFSSMAIFKIPFGRKYGDKSGLIFGDMSGIDMHSERKLRQKEYKQQILEDINGVLNSGDVP